MCIHIHEVVVGLWIYQIGVRAGQARTHAGRPRGARQARLKGEGAGGAAVVRVGQLEQRAGGVAGRGGVQNADRVPKPLAGGVDKDGAGAAVCKDICAVVVS